MNKCPNLFFQRFPKENVTTVVTAPQGCNDFALRPDSGATSHENYNIVNEIIVIPCYTGYTELYPKVLDSFIPFKVDVTAMIGGMGGKPDCVCVCVEYFKDLKVVDKRYNLPPIIMPSNIHIFLYQH